MKNHDLILTEYDPIIFQADDGSNPFQFAIYMPSTAVKMTRMAADTLRTQLLDIIPGHNHEIHVTDNVAIGDETIVIYPHMLALRLDYLDQDARYLTMQFSQDDANLVLH